MTPADQRQPTRLTIRSSLLEVARLAKDEIDAAFWRFPRMRRALPPVLAVPHAYDAQKRARALLAQLGRTTDEERAEFEARRDAMRCIKCGALPDQSCAIADEGGLCRRRVA